MKNLKEIIDYVNGLPKDYRAECIISLLKSDGLDEKDIIISNEGQLKRQYSKDIDKAGLTEFNNGDFAVTFHLNRDGIYDELPEALFHKFTDEQLISGEEMARDSMKLKAEEKEVRNFFMPFESQIFFQLSNLASSENDLTQRIYSNLLQGIIPDFWNISRSIPEEYRDRLIMLIPMAHHIIGDIELTRQAFEFVLREIVSIELLSSTIDVQSLGGSDISSVGGLGDSKLGVDFISGDIPEISGNFAKVTIGPVCNLDISRFISGGWVKILCESLYNYFFPMDLIADTIILPGSDTEGFSLAGEKSESSAYMGYNTILN